MSCAAFLGIDMPTVGVGEAVYPRLDHECRCRGSGRERGASRDHGQFLGGRAFARPVAGVVLLLPGGPGPLHAGMDSALRMNLSDALSDALDKQILAGTGGLFTGSRSLRINNVAAVTTYALYRDHLAYGRVDGTYAGIGRGSKDRRRRPGPMRTRRRRSAPTTPATVPRLRI